MSFEQIAWLPLCAGLTAVGVALSWMAFRRRGAAAGLRAAAWSLLPIAAYLTGALRTLWNIGSAVVGFVTGLVLSPMVWAGVVLAGLSALLFLVSGALRGRALARGRTAGASAGGVGSVAGRPAAKPIGRAGAGSTAATETKSATGSRSGGDDDFAEIEDILKRRGIG
jgi:hypothetical protein